jgi:hypothetical protein
MSLVEIELCSSVSDEGIHCAGNAGHGGSHYRIWVDRRMEWTNKPQLTFTPRYRHDIASVDCSKYTDGEPVFIIRAQDECAASMLVLWLVGNPQISAQKRDEVRDCIDAMRAWPRKKRAD